MAASRAAAAAATTIPKTTPLPSSSSSAAAAAAAAFAYTDTTGRAIHIRIHPRPANVAESRQILRKLGEFGEVAMYKHLKHEPELRAANTALAIYRTTDAATRCLSASPVRFTLDLTPPPSSSSSSPYTALTLLHPPTTRRASSSSPHTNNPPTTTPPRTFSLHITPSTTNHSAYISRQHYTGRFTLNKRTVMAVDLADRVPLKGLADCRMTVGEVPLRLRKVRAEEERVEGRGVWKVGPGEVWRGLVERREREKSMGKGLDGGGDGVGADEALRTP